MSGSALFRQDRAGAFAAEEFAEDEAVFRDKTIDDLGDLDDAGDPEKETGRHEQGDAHPEKADRAGPTVDLAGGGDAMDRLEQILARDLRSDHGGAFVFQRHHLDDMTPVEPGKETALEGAEGAVAVVEEDVFHVGVTDHGSRGMGLTFEALGRRRFTWDLRDDVLPRWPDIRRHRR